MALEGKGISESDSSDSGESDRDEVEPGSEFCLGSSEESSQSSSFATDRIQRKSVANSNNNNSNSTREFNYCKEQSAESDSSLDDGEHNCNEKFLCLLAVDKWVENYRASHASIVGLLALTSMDLLDILGQARYIIRILFLKKSWKFVEEITSYALHSLSFCITFSKTTRSMILLLHKLTQHKP